MRISIFKSVSQAFQTSKIEERCTEKANSIMQHAIKQLVWPSSNEAKGHWLKEIAAEVGHVTRKTKSKVKAERIKGFLYDELDARSFYLASVEDMREKPERTFEDIAPQLEIFYDRLSSAIANSCNAKQASVIRTSQIKEWL
jgi:hypothetical protein